MQDKDNIELIDIEDYKGGKDQKFSHQILVMKILSKCIENGAKEMRPGYYNEKTDKFGNPIKTYVPDSRNEFISSVKTAMSVLARDYDSKINEFMNGKKEDKDKKGIKEKISDEYKILIELEKSYWNNMPMKVKQNMWSNNVYYQEGTLNIKLPYSHNYIEFEVKCYHEILEQLLKLIKRLDDYQSEDYEN